MKKVIAGVLLATAVASTAFAQGTCDRACLLKTADDYLAALVAHDPSKAPMAPNAKFTEQTKVMKVGEEGLWKSAISTSTTFKIPVPDATSGQIGMIVMMKAAGTAFPAPPPRGNAPARDPNAPADIQLALRLKVANRQITEAVPREAQARQGAASSNGFGDLPSDCAGQLTSRAMSYINSIDLRRIWIADEERGLVFGLTMFRHPMEQKSITILKPDGTTSERPMNFNALDLEAAHIFKIHGDKIHEIEGMGFTLPLYSKNGWNPFIK